MDTRVTFNMKEIKRLHLIEQIVDQHITSPQAAELLGLFLRQVRRLGAKYRQLGAPGMAHGNRGKQPNNQIAPSVRDPIVGLAENQYRDYNDCHFTEELAEKHHLPISRSTLRRIRRGIGQKSPR
jgi:hypothetical protein